MENALLSAFITAAREKAETYCNREFISKTVKRTFTIDKPLDIASEDILEVSGFYTSINEAISAASYFNNYRKGIVVSRDYPIDYSNLPTYTVKYQVTVDPAEVPEAVKIAICKIASDLYENRENGSFPSNGITYKTLLAPFRKL
ncbi:head-tail connector protein [Hymenobacter canadensis]|uniref:Phage gp6-like head-tail connector protein n=1 Tax=Hymenobacter canadensis TaxID=2999067 RepID=A0ABY7LWP8_9BACT|nr:head-tail connector protein [Hymenobacter canadensis]WBA43170.1 phage gp6-like head-tail connector protein [Hymenobacter canadensis]